jgi:hypothetical protein
MALDNSELEKLEQLFKYKKLSERIRVFKDLEKRIGFTDAVFVAKSFHKKHWCSEFKIILEKNKLSENVFDDVVRLIYVDYLKLMPYDFSFEKKQDALIIRCFNACQILESCTACGLDTGKVCCGIFNEPMQALVSMINPTLAYERLPERIRPRQAFCEERIFFKK